MKSKGVDPEGIGMTVVNAEHFLYRVDKYIRLANKMCSNEVLKCL